MKETELKPCPFCGSEKVSVKYLYFRPFIICDKCHAQIPCYNNYKEAKGAWNRRATDERSGRKIDWKDIKRRLR